MKKWFFPTRGYGKTEGFANANLEMFKGKPIRSMAREVCQNSLDAKKDNDKPVRIEFENHFIKTTDFPGTSGLRDVLKKCQVFWNDGDEKTRAFISDALKAISAPKMFVLRISDYNTTGLKGAFEDNDKTPWKGLVQGTAFSVKTSDSAAGSYGIGKGAPFVVSRLQTVFYRTFDEKGTRAAQGVAQLVAFEAENVPAHEDPVRMSTGYYSEGNRNTAFKKIEELDKINIRDEHGTDLFIPGFNQYLSKTGQWKDDIIVELLENFLYSIYSGKMEIVVDKTHINSKTIDGHISRLMPKTKNAAAFYNVISEDNDKVIEITKEFHNLGTLRLRLLYDATANKKVLVVRKSGMKIADIPSLPKSVPFTGFLELQGEELNKFFRKMENPEHNKWEHNRHPNYTLAKKYKEEVENWVRESINEKIKEISGDEIDIDMSSYFITADKTPPANSEEYVEKVIDTVKNIDVVQDEPKPKNFKVKDVGSVQKGRNTQKKNIGTIDDEGEGFGHRRRTGTRSGASPTGRKGVNNTQGDDTIYGTVHEVNVSARIIKRSTGVNKLIFTAEEDINQGELEIVTVGENGKPLQIAVKSLQGIGMNAELSDGHIVVYGVKADQKYILEFETFSGKNYAMGVRVYGD